MMEDEWFVRQVADECRRLFGGPFVFVQVGALGAEEGLMVGQIAGASVTCYEAHPVRAKEYMAEPRMSVLTYSSLAIGVENADSIFYSGPGTGCSSLINRGGETFHVKQARLDSLHGQIDALLIDTEGTTMEVLVGAGDLLARTALVVAEVQLTDLYPGHARGPEVSEYLAGYGLKRNEALGYSVGSQANWFWSRS